MTRPPRQTPWRMYLQWTPGSVDGFVGFGCLAVFAVIMIVVFIIVALGVRALFG